MDFSKNRETPDKERQRERAAERGSFITSRKFRVPHAARRYSEFAAYKETS